MKCIAVSLVAFGAIVSITGCRMGPNYKRPVIANNPATFRGMTAPDMQQAPGATPLGAQKWNTVFTDPVIQELIAEAIKNNYDVKIAADHVLEQQDQLGITRAAQFPTLSLGGTYDAIGIPSGIGGFAGAGR